MVSADLPAARIGIEKMVSREQLVNSGVPKTEGFLVVNDRAHSLQYAAKIGEAAKARDFLTFRPWEKASAENDLTWKYRVVHDLAEEFAVDSEQVLIDLEGALKIREMENRRCWRARIPAMLSTCSQQLKRSLAKFALVPAARMRYTALVSSLQRTSISEWSSRKNKAQTLASIVVLSFNRLQYLRTTLASLNATTIRETYELVVVDNGSIDGSVGFLTDLASKGFIDKLMLYPKNLGTSAGFNAGFAAADQATRYLIKLDSDIVLLTPGWLERFHSFYERQPETGLLALRQINHGSHIVARKLVVGGETVLSWNVSVIGGACMTVPRTLFAKLGYFCDDFNVKLMPDDVDYAARVAILGHPSYYLFDTLAYQRNDGNGNWSFPEKQKRLERLSNKKRMAELRRQYITGKRSVRCRPLIWEQDSELVPKVLATSRLSD